MFVQTWLAMRKRKLQIESVWLLSILHGYVFFRALSAAVAWRVFYNQSINQSMIDG